MAKVFVSYRRHESGYVAQMLKDRLVQQFGADSVFLDIDNIPFGVDFREHIDREVQQCDVMLVLIGDAWLTAMPGQQRSKLFDLRDFVRTEIEAALKRNIRIVPLLSENAAMPNPEELPESIQGLAYRNAAELRAGRDFNYQMTRLIDGLKELFPVPSGASIVEPEPVRSDSLRREPQRSLPAQVAIQADDHSSAQSAPEISSSESAKKELPPMLMREAILKHFGRLLWNDVSRRQDNLHIRDKDGIPQQTLRNMIESCGPSVNESDVVLLYEYGPSLLLTESALSWRSAAQSRLVDFRDVKSLRRVNHSRFLYVNDDMMSFSNSEEVLAKAVAEFLEMLATLNNASADAHLAMLEGLRSSASRRAALTPTFIRKAILKYFDGLGAQMSSEDLEKLHIKYVHGDIPTNKLRNAIKSYAQQVKEDDVVLLYEADETDGVLLTEKSLCWSSARSSRRVDFSDVTEVVQDKYGAGLNGIFLWLWNEHFKSAMTDFLRMLAAHNNGQ